MQCIVYVCSYENTTCRKGKGKILGTYTVVEATSYKSLWSVVSLCVTAVMIKMAENTIEQMRLDLPSIVMKYPFKTVIHEKKEDQRTDLSWNTFENVAQFNDGRW